LNVNETCKIKSDKCFSSVFVGLFVKAGNKVKKQALEHNK